MARGFARLPRVLQVLYLRGQRRGGRPSPGVWPLLFPAALAGWLVALGVLAAGWQYQNLARQLPPPEALLRWVDPVQGLWVAATQVEDARGQALARLQPRETAAARYLPASQWPPLLREALAWVWNPTLWPQEPPGDPAQELARMLLQAQGTASRPPAEDPTSVAFLAAQLHRRYGEGQLLEWWVNLRPTLPGVHGMDALAWALWARPATRLDPEQTLLLALYLRWPELLRSPETLRARYRRLAQALVTAGREDLPLTVTAVPQNPDLPLHPDAQVAWWLEQWLQRGPGPLPARGRVVRLSLETPMQQGLTCLIAQAYGRWEAACPPLPPWPDEPLPPGVAIEAAVVDPATGRLLALAFPQDQEGPLPRPVGTTLAPWLYAAAFTRGWSPATLMWDVPAALNPVWEGLANHDGRFHGPLQAGPALSNAYEVPLALLLDRFGAASLAAMLANLGWPVRPQELLTVPQGLGPQATLPEVLHRLALFASLGQWTGWRSPQGSLEPILFTRAWTLDGQPERLPAPERQLRLSPGLAYLVTYALSNPAWWRPPLPQAPLSRPTALLVGRAEQGSLVWVVGYSPQRVLGLVLDARGLAFPQERLEGWAVTLWLQMDAWVHQELPTQRWPRPQEVVEVPVCVPSGLLPTEDCPLVELMPFLQAYAPSQADTLYRRFYVNAHTGRLATVFTPPEWVEERVYLVYPPEAEAWAREAGRELPPTEYDPVTLPQAPPYARVRSPEPFTYVTGQVPVLGTASAPDFAWYRLQVGRGLFPRRWQVVTEGQQPVENGLLGVWETEGQEPGLYVLQLQVVDARGRLWTHSVQVTVDHRPPRLEVLAPREGPVALQPEGGLFVHVRAQDDYQVAWVRVLLDGREVMRFGQPPYRGLVPVSPGPHRLVIEARDAAGNTARTTLDLFVPDLRGR